jgi:hypothetical protein
MLHRSVAPKQGNPQLARALDPLRTRSVRRVSDSVQTALLETGWLGLQSPGKFVESRMGASTDAEAPPRFPSPLIKPDVRISRIRLFDWLHR